MINEQSRYSKGHVVWVDHPVQGRVQVVHLQPVVWDTYPYTQYQATSADSLTTLAHQAYGNAPDYWWIAEMNPAVECPDDLSVGQIIRLPVGRPT